MKLAKANTAVALALLLASSGCAYLRPEPSLLGDQTAHEDGAMTSGDKAGSEHDGLLGFLEQTTYNVCKGFQETGR